MGNRYDEGGAETAKRLAALAGATPADAVAIKQAIQVRLEPFEPLHVLAMLAEVAVRTPSSEDPLPAPAPSVIEYLATVILERPYAASAKVDAPDYSKRARDAATECLKDAEHLYSLTQHARVIDSAWATSPLKQLAADRAFREVSFRWPSYPEQEECVARELFSPPEVRDALRDGLGFDADGAFEFMAACEQIVVIQRDIHRRFFNDLLDRKAQSDPRLKALSATKRRLLAGALALGPELVEPWTVSAVDLGVYTGQKWQTSTAFLTMLSSRFGHARGTHLLDGRSKLRFAPFVTTDGEGFLPMGFDNARRAIRPLLERSLPQDVFDGVYQRHRASWLERRTAELFGDLLPGATIYENLEFDLGGIRNLEVDVLVRLDHVCFVVEAKSGGIPERGNLKQALKSTIGKSAAQVGRLSSAIRTGSPPTFRDRASKASVTVDLDGVERVEPVTVSIEDLGFLASRTTALVDGGMVAEGDEIPWVVTVFDLETIASISAHPAEFTTYVKRRRDLDYRVLLLDELEVWLLHVAESLEFNAIDAPMILVQDRVAALDDSLLLGAPTRPAMKMKSRLRGQLKHENASREPGWLERCESLIDGLQASRTPTHWTFAATGGVAVCAPADPRTRQRRVRDVY